MPIPLIPIIAALAASGTSLVPHAAGGLIVSGASGYIAGTYLSTVAISGLIATASTTLGVGALYLSGAMASIVGSAGIFGTTIGASGITGMLMSVGIISSTPVWIPITVGGAALSCGYGSYRLMGLQKKINATPAGQEAQFTQTEAKIVENILKRLGRKAMKNGSLVAGVVERLWNVVTHKKPDQSLDVNAKIIADVSQSETEVLKNRLEALEGHILHVEEQIGGSVELIKAIAEQNIQLAREIELNSVRLLRLAVATAICAVALVGIIVYMLLQP